MTDDVKKRDSAVLKQNLEWWGSKQTKKGTTKNKCVRVRVAKEEEKIAIP